MASSNFLILISDSKKFFLIYCPKEHIREVGATHRFVTSGAPTEAV